MRVLHLLSSTGFHGAETMAAELIRHSAAFGIESHVGVFDNGGRGDRQILDAVKPTGTPGVVIPCRGQFDRAAVAAIARHVRDHRIDVVHSHKYKTTFHALLARRRQSFALLATYHNWLRDSFMLKVYAVIDKRLARYCDAAVGVSSVVAAELARYAPAKRVHYIGNGIDTERYFPAPERAAARRQLQLDDSPAIGFVGRLTPQKGVKVLIEAFASLTTSSAQLLIVGDGESRAGLEAAARASPASARIHFLGTRSDTPDIFRALDLFVLPSYVEAFPMVLLEAMATEVPVIGTPVGDVPRIIDIGETGWITPTGDVAALAACLAASLANSLERQRMGRAARATVIARHSADNFAARYSALYQQIVQERAAR